MINEMPIAIDIRGKDDGDGIVSTLVRHNLDIMNPVN